MISLWNARSRWSKRMASLHWSLAGATIVLRNLGLVIGKLHALSRSRRAPAETLVTLQQAPTSLKKGTYRVRFANVDHRLTVWVDQCCLSGTAWI